MILETLGLLFVFTVWRYLYHNGKKQPPGPPKLPIVGNLLQLALEDSVPHIALHKLSLKYGPVMSMKFGFLNTVILSSHLALKEIYSREEASDRQSEGIFHHRSLCQNIGILLGNGKTWKDTRRFTIKTLREYGFSKRSSMKNIFEEELQTLMSQMKTLIKKNDGIIRFDSFFGFSTVNILWSLVAGIKLNSDDTKFADLVEGACKLGRGSPSGAGLLLAFPFLQHALPNWTGYNEQKNINTKFHEYMREVLQDYRVKLKEKSEPECFIDVLLFEMERTKTDPNTIFTEDQLVMILVDLFQGASETTATFLQYSVLFMTVRQDVQKKVISEIGTVVGFERNPELQDREKMIYTQATMLEVFRWARTFVNYVPHVANSDFYYENMLIKKDTVIIGNQHSIHFDKTFWGDPEVFRPERFVDTNGLLVKEMADNVVPFSTGRRVCIGENLARDSAFLFFTKLVQTFSFETVPCQPTPSVDPVVGFLLYPSTFDALVAIRT